MKKLIALLGLVMCFVYGASAQSKQQAEVAKAVEQLRLAMISGQKADLDAIAADSLSYGHSSGKVQNKTEFMESFITKASVFVSITLTDQTIKVVGNTAIVRHKLSAQTADGGKPGSVNLGIVLVFVKQKGAWKLLVRQAFKLPLPN